jgi:hypothetical protein
MQAAGVQRGGGEPVGVVPEGSHRAGREVGNEGQSVE